MGGAQMSSASTFAAILERFFVERMRQQRHASNHTIASYRDTFRPLFAFAQDELHKRPCQLELSDFTSDLIGSFLNHLEQKAAPVRELATYVSPPFVRSASLLAFTKRHGAPTFNASSPVGSKTGAPV
jgi:hypothetical protein